MAAGNQTQTSTPAATSKQPPAPPVVKPVDNRPEWVQKLVTKEDPYHVHKTLGILAILSFYWRVAYFSSNPRIYDYGFAVYPGLTLPTIALHFFLNASAFEFLLPKRRIKDGDRIWPEYRAHSLVFTCRSLAIMLLVHFEQTFNLPPNYFMNYVIVIGTMVSADLVSNHFGKYSSNSIRDLDSPKVVRYFFSLMQFLGTSTCLIGQRRFGAQFFLIMVVQGNAFNMTLRRKNITNHMVCVAIYGMQLSLVGYGIFDELYYPSGYAGMLVTITGVTAFLWRTTFVPGLPRFLQNKYFVWTVMALFINYHRGIAFHKHWRGIYFYRDEIPWLWRNCIKAVFIVGCYQCTFGYQKRETKKVAEEPPKMVKEEPSESSPTEKPVQTK